MYLIGLDPSFTNAGCATIDTDNKELVFRSVGKPIGEKTFSNIVKNVDYVTSGLLSLVSPKIRDMIIITETPPASGYFASGLFGLDIHLILTLKQRGYDLFGVSPVYLSHIHGTRKYKKSDSVILAKKFIEVFKQNHYTVKLDGRLSNDMAEAFIFASRLFVSIYRNTIAYQLTGICKALDDEKEFAL